MRLLLATTCLSPLVIAAPPAAAQTVIAAARTAEVRTCTVKNGTADNLRIAAAGSVKPSGGAAVTVDSVNTVTNEGTVQVTNADGATGIAAVAGGQGTITNAATGKITVDETCEPTDADKDGDLDGPLATGSGRAGIRTLGAFTGNVVNAGAITVEGNDPGGIALGGRLTGSLTTDGTVAVTGDRSVGVRLGEVSGPVRLAGTISVSGNDAVGVLVGGDLARALASGESATGLRVGSGASVPEIRVAGTVGANGGGSTGHQATAILVGEGAQVATIRTSGTVKAVPGADGSAAAIVDRAGTVRLVENIDIKRKTTTEPNTACGCVRPSGIAPIPAPPARRHDRRRTPARRPDHLDGAVAHDIARHLRFVEGELADIEQRIAALIAAHPCWARLSAALQTIEGVGPQTATALITHMPELGTIGRRQIAALAGLAPINRDSGASRNRRFVQGGRTTLKTALYLAALSAARFNPDLKTFYQRPRGNGKCPKVALVAVARKLLTILSAVAKHSLIPA